MPADLCEQTVSFMACFTIGLIMAFIYDIYGAVRHVFKIRKAFVFVFDSMFFIMLAIAFFAVLYITCGGKLRWFVVAGLVFGLLIYIFGVSINVQPVIEKILLVSAGIFKKILCAFLLPVKQILRFFRFVFTPIVKIVHCALKKALFFVKNTIEKIRGFSVKLLRYVIK